MLYVALVIKVLVFIIGGISVGRQWFMYTLSFPDQRSRIAGLLVLIAGIIGAGFLLYYWMQPEILALTVRE